MIEVEAKIKISDVGKFREKVMKLGKFIRKEKKVDNYYTLENLRNYPRKSLRVRKRAGHHEVNFKQRLSYVNGVHTKNEHEFILYNIEPFLDLIKDFGFKHWLRKEKITEIYEIGKNFNIEINNVKKLGWFLEVEYLCDLKDVNYARKKVLEIISKLGIDKKDIVEEGYTKMLWERG